jgi:acetyl-CoA carboxylase carboxyl transferase subunit beta
MIKKTFNRKKYISIHNKHLLEQDDNNKLAQRINCSSCSALLWETDLIENNLVCPRCSYHFPMNSGERIDLLVDENSFCEFDSGLTSCNILDFPGYEEKLTSGSNKSELNEAIVTGYANIAGCKVVLGVMDSNFMMASMGSVVGEKFCRAVERAINDRCPLIMCTASGGARMQEGMVALMQMAKTSSLLARFHDSGLLYISLLTHPTTGGVLASFASLADIIIAEPGALIGFAGPRVIEQTIKQKLPEGFQRSEFLLEHGMIDLVVNRKEIKEKLALLLKLHQGGTNG